MNNETLTDNKAWLAGYAAHGRGEDLPWGDESARKGWLAARTDANEES